MWASQFPWILSAVVRSFSSHSCRVWPTCDDDDGRSCRHEWNDDGQKDLSRGGCQSFSPPKLSQVGWWWQILFRWHSRMNRDCHGFKLSSASWSDGPTLSILGSLLPFKGWNCCYCCGDNDGLWGKIGWKIASCWTTSQENNFFWLRSFTRYGGGDFGKLIICVTSVPKKNLN